MTLNEALDRIKSLERSWARCEELCLERGKKIAKLEAQIDRMYELQAQHTEAEGMLAQERDRARAELAALRFATTPEAVAIEESKPCSLCGAPAKEGK